MIICVGVGPGDLSFITQQALLAIQSADVVAGFDAVLNIVSPIIAAEAEIIAMTYRNQTEKLLEVAALHHQGRKCVVAFMGDIHFSGFQYLERVERACGHEVETMPGISSAQILASRAKVCFDETSFVTFHRRGELEPFKEHLRHSLRLERNAIVIPRPYDFMPEEIARYLLIEGTNPELQVEVWENLTMREASWTGTLGSLGAFAGMGDALDIAYSLSSKSLTSQFSDMSIILIRAEKPFPSQIFTDSFDRLNPVASGGEQGR
jgi:cobalt-precorrin-7 (C5)-methyltransferase